MTSRIIAITFGIIAGCAAAAACGYGWGEIIALISVYPPETAAALSAPANHAAWTISAFAAAFAVISLLTALAGGIAETILARRRIIALSGMPAAAGSSNAGEWRVIFAGTSIAAPVDAALAVTSAGTSSLLDLDRIWLDRMTLRKIIEPLPLLILAADGAMALFSEVAGTGFALALGAGICGWLVISFARYLVSLALTLFIARAMAAAVEAIQPVASAPDRGALATAPAALFQPSISQAAARPAPETDAIAREVADILAEPLERLADAADRLSSTGPAPSREHAVDAALAEIRAGIERLLAASTNR